ncbi:MAG TPA: hypothetical protein ENG74_01305, partial [Thermoplasmatales archaeon]|nr:hypothetical protein [Thermoplasmatales archaeon]
MDGETPIASGTFAGEVLISPGAFGKVSKEEKYVRIQIYTTGWGWEKVPCSPDREKYTWVYHDPPCGHEFIIHFCLHTNLSRGNESQIVYEFDIKFKLINRPSYPDIKMAPLPNIGNSITVRRGEWARFSGICWNPCDLYSTIANKEITGWHTNESDPNAGRGNALLYMTVNYRLFWGSPWSELDVSEIDDENIFPNRDYLMPGGSPGGEYITVITYSGFHSLPVIGIVGDKPGRAFFLASKSTENLPPGNYTFYIGYIATWKIPPWEGGGSVAIHVQSGDGKGGFQSFDKENTCRLHRFIGVGVVNPAALAFNVTVLPSDEKSYTEHEDMKISPRMHKIEGPIIQGEGLDAKLNCMMFNISCNGDRLAKMNTHRNIPALCDIQSDIDIVKPWTLSDDSIIVMEKSLMFDMMPKKPVEIFDGEIKGKKVIAIPRLDALFLGSFMRTYDVALGRPPTPPTMGGINTYGEINGKAVRIDPPKPFNAVKIKVLDSTDGYWPDYIPSTYNWDLYGNIPPFENEIDTMCWNHRRYPRVGKWVDRIEDVPAGTKLRFRVEIDLTSIGKPPLARKLIFPLKLTCTLPDGIVYENGSAGIRFGQVVCMNSPIADKWNKDLFSWSALRLQFEPSFKNRNRLQWDLPNQPIFPIPFIVNLITQPTDPPWYTTVNSKEWSVLGKSVKYHPLNYYPGPPYHPFFWSMVGVGGIDIIEITFNATVTIENATLNCWVGLQGIAAPELFQTYTGNFNEMVSILKAHDSIMLLSNDTVTIKTRSKKNRPPVVEVIYPKDGEKDVPVHLRELAVRVYDPDGDKMSVSF